MRKSVNVPYTRKRRKLFATFLTRAPDPLRGRRAYGHRSLASRDIYDQTLERHADGLRAHSTYFLGIGGAQELHLGLVHHMEAVRNEGFDGGCLRSRIRNRPGYPLDDDPLRDDDTYCRTGSEGKETENQQT